MKDLEDDNLFQSYILGGSRSNYRCALRIAMVPDMETKTPTHEPTDIPSISPTKVPTIPTISINITECPELDWPDLEDDCEQYCLNTTNIEREIAHISSLYKQLTDTTTIVWSVTIENDH